MSSRPPAQVLYVTYDGLLEPLGASQVLPYLRGLSTAGVHMEVLSFEKPEDLSDVARVRALAAELEAAGIGWRRMVYHKRPSLPATAWDVFQGRREVARWAAEVRREGGVGLVHARGYIPGLMGLAARKAAPGIQLLFDMRGFWVDERIEGGYWAPGSLPVRLGRATERRLLREADQLILLTHRAAGRLPALAEREQISPWTVVPTCVDLEKFTLASDAAEARRAVGLRSGPVLIHIGTLTGWYDGEATMEVARAFLEQGGGTFVVLTRDAPEARHMAAEAGVDAVVATVPSAQVPMWLRAADGGLALVRPSPSKDASFPTKVGEYLASGLAVLGTSVGDMERMASPGLIRLMGPGDDAGAMAGWLLEAAARPGRQEQARALAAAELSLDRGVTTLLEVYASMGVQGRAP